GLMFAVPNSAKDSLGQSTLPRSKRVKRHLQAVQGGVALLSMPQLLLGPLQEFGAQSVEYHLEFCCAAGFATQSLAARGDIEIHESKLNFVLGQLLAHHVAIQSQLGPVQLTLAGRHVTQ